MPTARASASNFHRTDIQKLLVIVAAENTGCTEKTMHPAVIMIPDVK
jgi:hypothetical protein